MQEAEARTQGRVLRSPVDRSSFLQTPKELRNAGAGPIFRELLLTKLATLYPIGTSNAITKFVADLPIQLPLLKARCFLDA